MALLALAEEPCETLKVIRDHSHSDWIGGVFIHSLNMSRGLRALHTSEKFVAQYDGFDLEFCIVLVVECLLIRAIFGENGCFNI